MDLIFSPLREEHLEEILCIENASFPQPWTRSMFARELTLPISHFFVLLESDRVAGYGGYWLIADEAHIVNIAVHPRLRARGVGRELLCGLLEQIALHGAQRILLEVRAGNLPAQKLYESAGFRVSGIRRRYYGDEDAILMERIRDVV